MSEYWTCKIGPVDRDELPDGADFPMRMAVEQAFKDLTGRDAEFNFSGWGGSLDKGEQKFVDEERERMAKLQ